jgi:hypothetical protein
MTDITADEVVIDRSTELGDGKEFPVFDDFGRPLGFELTFFPEPLILVNTSQTRWDSNEIFPIAMEPYLAAGFLKGLRNPADYRIEMLGPGEGQSTELEARRRLVLPSRPTNFRVINVSTGQEINYAFWDLTGDDFISAESTAPASFSADPQVAESDRIILIEPAIGDESGTEVVTWQISLNFVLSNRRNPATGEVADIAVRKPFLSSDVFEFTARGPQLDTEMAKDQLANIRVVPNPYVVTNRFEPLNPFTTGRGPRVIQFTNLPPQCTIRIFTVGGRLVRELERNVGSNENLEPADLLNGSMTWDLESIDRLTVSYGVYVYHVEAPGIGEHEGTFAIIK